MADRKPRKDFWGEFSATVVLCVLVPIWIPLVILARVAGTIAFTLHRAFGTGWNYFND